VDDIGFWIAALTRMPAVGGHASKARLTLAATLLVGTLIIPTSPVAASQSMCPDGMVPMFVIFDPDLAKKDRNGNGIVCVKSADSGTKGGPDDRIVSDDIIV
jgi:hypothetical protein